jgi:ferredoxin--NADP+ reductase
MSRVLDNKRINSQVTFMKLEAPHVVKNARPGQFIVIKIDEKGERIPLTIVESDEAKGTISIIFQEVGKTTKKLATLGYGSEVMDVIGPLGKPTHIKKFGKILCIGGGVGTAEIYPVAKAFKEIGNEMVSIIGARNKELLFLINEMKAINTRLYVVTDDGSIGRKGLVTDVLGELLKKEHFNLVYAVGPILMMWQVAAMTKKYNVKTIVSLNANMVDATGMCGTCRVKVGDKIKFTCVDGPEFDAHQIDFSEFITRDKRFKSEEEESLRCYAKKDKLLS